MVTLPARDDPDLDSGRCADELQAAIPEAIAACEALVSMCRDGPPSLGALEIAARRVALAAGLVAGFAHMSGF